MKRLLVFAALVAVLALSVSLGGPGTAYAAPLCDDIHGDPCSPNGSTTACTTSDNWPSSCTCRLGHWRCLL